MLILGHRGASASHAENTLAAFVAAASAGADGVELDVRRTADGHAAVRHDPTLPDGTPLVALQSADLPPWLPTLADALDACAGMRVVNVEIKNWPADPDFDPSEALAGRVVAELAVRTEQERQAVIVSSFHRPTVDRVRELDPALATGLLTMVMADITAAIDEVVEHGHRAIHPHVSTVDAALVERAHERDLLVATWTVDDARRLRELNQLGVDAAITNDPAAALEAIGRS